MRQVSGVWQKGRKADDEFRRLLQVALRSLHEAVERVSKNLERVCVCGEDPGPGPGAW